MRILNLFMVVVMVMTVCFAAEFKSIEVFKTYGYQDGPDQVKKAVEYAVRYDNCTADDLEDFGIDQKYWYKDSLGNINETDSGTFRYNIAKGIVQRPAEVVSAQIQPTDILNVTLFYRKEVPAALERASRTEFQSFADGLLPTVQTRVEQVRQGRSQERQRPDITEIDISR